MTQRITIKDLETLCGIINEMTNSPMTPYSEAISGEFKGKIKANIGNFHIYQAYGGVCLHRMHNLGGAVSTPLSHSTVTKRQLWDSMHALISGIRLKAA